MQELEFVSIILGSLLFFDPFLRNVTVFAVDSRLAKKKKKKMYVAMARRLSSQTDRQIGKQADQPTRRPLYCPQKRHEKCER